MSIWQTLMWQNLLLKSNQALKTFEIDGIFIEKRFLGLKQYGLFILGIDKDKKINEKNIIDLCKKENCLFVQIESYDLENKNYNLKLGEGFKIGYYKKFITPFTAIINLDKSEDEILSQMKPKGRYNINLAIKKGIEVIEVEKNDENIKIFYNLMLETTFRDKFNGNKIEYYKNFLEIIPGSSLIFTKLEEKILSAGIFVFDKNVSIYYYGASTSKKEFRNLMAPYLIQWFAIKKAKNTQSKYYDFLGIATPGDEKSSLIGVTDFKMKFTGEVINCSSSYIWINNNFKYNLFNFIKKFKNAKTITRYFR